LFRKYVFSLDHTVIGLQYALTSLFFLLIGFSLAVLFRWPLAYPGQPVPIVGRWLGELNAPEHSVSGRRPRVWPHAP
jgi:cytochrome c oxidase subunit I